MYDEIFCESRGDLGSLAAGKQNPFQVQHFGISISNMNVNKHHQRILAMRVFPPPADRAAVLITAEQHRRITILSKTSHSGRAHSKAPAIQSQPIQGPLALQSRFCSKTACRGSLLQEHKDPQCRKRIPPPPFSLYCLISSGNFPLQLVPWDYHLALKPWRTSAHRTNETPELGDGQIAKWYLSSTALWLCSSLPPSPLSCVKCPWGAFWGLRGQWVFLDKGKKLRTTQLY